MGDQRAHDGGYVMANSLRKRAQGLFLDAHKLLLEQAGPWCGRKENQTAITNCQKLERP